MTLTKLKILAYKRDKLEVKVVDKKELRMVYWKSAHRADSKGGS